jgi:hypothetical protein
VDRARCLSALVEFLYSQSAKPDLNTHLAEDGAVE